MNKQIITHKGRKKLEEELKILKQQKRPEVIKAIAHARSMGDLSENADYHAAKDQQGLIESKIKDLENKNVNIWNGEEFSDVKIKYTGDQEIYKVILSNSMELDCSPGHKWLIQKGNQNHPERCVCEEIETIDLKVGDIIEKYHTPFIEFTDPDEYLNPYMHGFFCGDGSYCNNYPIIYLYDKKWRKL